MSFDRFKKVKTDDRVMNQIQDNIDRFSQPIVSKISLDRYVLTGVFLKSGQTNRIPHKLGRTLLGWVICDKSAFSDIKSVDSASPKLTLDLECSADVIVSIEVF